MKTQARVERALGALLLAGVAASGARAAQEQAPEVWRPQIEPASDEPDAALAALELAEGFRAEVFAAEPMLANPVCLYVDRDGGVFVAETFRHFEGVTDMREHPTWLDEDLASRTVGDRLAMMSKHEGADFDAYARATDRVRWLADTDGDGRADVDTVFAEGFTSHEAGIGAGLLAHGDDVYFTCIPSLWRLRDADGNRRAEEREALSTGYGVNIALLGHDLHGLRIGPDGKLYFSSGDRGFHVETEDGVLAHPHTGAVLRCELDGSGLELFATGLRNPQELVFDEFGNLWTGDNNSDGGDQARWVHVVEGSDSGWRYAYQWLTEPNLRGPWNDEKLWHPHHEGQAAYLLPPVANLASGPSGLTYDRGTGLPERFARHFFLCDFRGDPAYSGIHAFTVVPKGAGWELGPVERLLWNGLPTDVDFGPDGSLFVSDWVNGWAKPGKGRIFRLFDPEAVAPDTAALLGAGVEGLEEGALGALLSHGDQRVRQMAQLELAERGAADALYAAAKGQDLLGRLHGLWGLGQLGDARAAEFLDDAEDELRVSAARILGDEAAAGHAAPEHGLALVAAVADPAPRVRMHAAIALGKWPERIAAEPLVELLRRDGADPVLRHAAVQGLLGQAGPEALVALADDPSVEVRLGAVVALRRLGDDRVAAFLADAEPSVVLEAARAIHDVPLPTAMGALSELAEALDPAGSAALARRAINANHHVHDQDAAGRLLRLALDERLDAGLRVEALARLTEWVAPGGRDAVVGAWRPVAPSALRDTGYLQWLLAGAFAPRSLARSPAEVQLAWCELAEAHGLEARAGWFAQLAADDERDPEVRVRALELLAAADDPRLAGTLEATLFCDAADVRAKALELVGAFDAERAYPLIEAAATRGELAERRAAYGLLAGLEDERAAALLAAQLAGLEQGEVPLGAALELVQAAEASAAAQTAGASALVELLAARAAERTDRPLVPYLDALHGGDAERGRELFTKRADLSCLRCHTTGEEEADLDRPAIGPTLAGLGGRATRLQNLTSIVDPNRSITGGFRGTLFFLLDGGSVEGQVLEDTAERVVVLDADGVEHELDPADIEVRRAGLSAMPEGLDQMLTPAEMRDLLEFLSGL